MLFLVGNLQLLLFVVGLAVLGASDSWQSIRSIKAGIVTMYPSLRGGVGNPGYNECFYGDFRISVGGRRSVGIVAADSRQMMTTFCAANFRPIVSCFVSFDSKKGRKKEKGDFVGCDLDVMSP